MLVFRPTLQKIWIKICGITRAQDALAAAELGADAIGLVFFAKSPRAVAIQDVAGIVKDLTQDIDVVALCVNPDPGFVRELLATELIDLLQFHGDESAEFCEQFSKPYMKAMSVKDDAKLDEDVAAYSSARYLLLDSYDPLMPGGSGKTFNWEKANQLSKKQKTRLVLAGGLDAGNIQSAIRSVQPFGVDVSSGVEASKGIKDPVKMKAFIEGIRDSG